MNEIQALVFDWAGTVQDHGSRAPVVALVDLFARFGVELSEAQARGPMGRFKLDHIRDILADASVATAWAAAHGRASVEDDAQHLYRSFGPLQDEAIVAHGELIDGIVPIVAACRERGMKIGSTTGYPRSAGGLAAAAAAQQGYAPDAMVCSDEVPAGRPAPWMLFRNLELVGVYPAWRVVKVGDTGVDIAEGRNAGTWTVGITRTGNLVGLSRDELEALDVDQQQTRVEHATAELHAAGADAVIPSVAELLPALDELGARIARGERPRAT